MKIKHSDIKRFLVKTPFYHFLLRLRSIYEYGAVTMFSTFSQERNLNTGYCISPYKTATTYITGLFNYSCKAAHEPLHYTTLLNISNNIFLKKRAHYLNLDIESSGFFAGRLGQVRRFAPTAPILMISRSPEDWIGSVVNYFRKLDNSVSYNYVARLIFDPICGAPVENFFDLSPMKQSAVVTALLEFWISTYQEAYRDSKVLVVPLEELDKRIGEIEAFLGHKSRPMRGSSWKLENKKKKPFSLRHHVDVHFYRKDIAALGYVV